MIWSMSHRCGGKDQQSRTCYTRKHIVKLYQKYRFKSEVHLVDKADPRRETTYIKDTTQLEINDLYMVPKRSIIELRYFYSYLLLLIIFQKLFLYNLKFVQIKCLFIQIIVYYNIHVILLLFCCYYINGHKTRPNTYRETDWKYVFSRQCTYTHYPIR